MFKKILAAGALIIPLMINGCASEPEITLTPLQIQAMQTKEFESSKSTAFASVISVFQDLGYIIESADLKTGLVTAVSPSDSSTDWLFTGNTYTSRTRATAFIEEIRKGHARVRLNFVVVNRTSSAWGQDSKEGKPVLSSKVYQNAFTRIGQAIFVRSGRTAAKVE